MPQVLINLQNLADPFTPLEPAQSAILRLLCEAQENGGRVPRQRLYATAELNDPNPVNNNYGLRRIIGSITQRLNSSDWYIAAEDRTVPGGRWYRLRENLRDGVCEILADHDSR